MAEPYSTEFQITALVQSINDARTPKPHAASHKDGEPDAIKLDELAAPSNTTALNASTSAHGLCTRLSGIETEFLNGLGEFSTPTGGGEGAVINLPGSSSVYYNGLGGWSTPTSSGSMFKPWVTIGKTGSGADYECDGTSDNVQIQEALSDVSSGTQIVFLQGVYNCTSPLAINMKSLWLSGVGNVTINFTLAGTQAAAMQFQGSSVLTTTLASNAAKGATSVVLTSTSGLRAGQLIVIYNNTIWSSYADYNDIQTGEMYEIRSVSGSTVYLSDPLVRAYTTSEESAARIFEPVEIHMENINIVGDGSSGDQMGLIVRYGNKISVNRCSFKDNNLSGIYLYTCYDADISGNSINNCTLDGLGYGVAVSTASAKVRVTNNNINNCRHCISVTSNKAVHGMNRDIIFSNNVCYGSSTITGAVDSHPNLINWTVSNNIIHGVNRGIINGAQHAIIEGNEFLDCSEGAIFHNKIINLARTTKIIGNKSDSGYFYSNTTTDPCDSIIIQGNECKGYIYVYAPSSRSIKTIKVTGNIMKDVNGKAIRIPLEVQSAAAVVDVSNNTIENCAQEGIYVDFSASVADNLVTISGNQIKNPNTSNGGYPAIRVYRAVGGGISNNVIYDANGYAGSGIATGTGCDYFAVYANTLRGMTGTKITLTGANNKPATLTDHNVYI